MTNGCLLIIKNNVCYSLATTHTGQWIGAHLQQSTAPVLLSTPPLALLQEVLGLYNDTHIAPLVARLKAPASLKHELKHNYFIDKLGALAEKLDYYYYNGYYADWVIDQDEMDVVRCDEDATLGRLTRWENELYGNKLTDLTFSNDGKRILIKKRAASR